MKNMQVRRTGPCYWSSGWGIWYCSS